jgi:hypothetical protein
MHIRQQQQQQKVETPIPGTAARVGPEAGLLRPTPTRPAGRGEDLPGPRPAPPL